MSGNYSNNKTLKNYGYFFVLSELLSCVLFAAADLWSFLLWVTVNAIKPSSTITCSWIQTIIVVSNEIDETGQSGLSTFGCISFRWFEQLARRIKSFSTVFAVLAARLYLALGMNLMRQEIRAVKIWYFCWRWLFSLLNVSNSWPHSLLRSYYTWR